MLYHDTLNTLKRGEGGKGGLVLSSCDTALTSLMRVHSAPPQTTRIR